MQLKTLFMLFEICIVLFPKKNKLQNPKESYENYDWDALKKKLPVEKTKEDRKNRLNLWKKLNEYGNGYISFKRLNVQLTNHLDLPEIIRNISDSNI